MYSGDVKVGGLTFMTIVAPMVEDRSPFIKRTTLKKGDICLILEPLTNPSQMTKVLTIYGIGYVDNMWIEYV